MKSASAAVVAPDLNNGSERARGRFYQPELDALRLFAFTSVLVHHGAGRLGAFMLFRKSGAFGLSLFFLLSAYLITQLLLREREQWGKIHLKSFYVRRILRIWPLYYATLFASYLLGLFMPHVFAINRTAFAGFAVFIVNWLPRTGAVGVFGAMWSISIEEQFYLVWPMVVKWRGRASVIAVSVLVIVICPVTLALFTSRGWMLWYDTFVEFLFFGTGGLLALIVGRSTFRLRPIFRFLLFGAGIASWLVAAGFGGIGTDRIPGLTLARLCVGYGADAVGCVAIFLAFLGLTNIPRPVVYLGKISFGLYVFHLATIKLAVALVSSRFPFTEPLAFWKIAVVDGLGFIFAVALAALSYRFLEMPFLQIKERFAFVRSRPATGV
jgi:peptidoglycan/LPS O-acetylase OafA/YrhL